MRVFITAILAVILNVPGPAPAAGAFPFPPSVKLFSPRGFICHATPMTDGLYSAGHCRSSSLSLGITAPALPFSVDKSRDLLHLAAPGAPGVQMRLAETNELGGWENSRGEGSARFTGQRDEYGAVWCVAFGHLWRGDSGTGLWANRDGALVGVFARASQLDDPNEWSAECGRRQAIHVVEVP